MSRPDPHLPPYCGFSASAAIRVSTKLATFSPACQFDDRARHDIVTQHVNQPARERAFNTGRLPCALRSSSASPVSLLCPRVSRPVRPATRPAFRPTSSARPVAPLRVPSSPRPLTATWRPARLSVVLPARCATTRASASSSNIFATAADAGANAGTASAAAAFLTHPAVVRSVDPGHGAAKKANQCRRNSSSSPVSPLPCWPAAPRTSSRPTWTARSSGQALALSSLMSPARTSPKAQPSVLLAARCATTSVCASKFWACNALTARFGASVTLYSKAVPV